MAFPITIGVRHCLGTPELPPYPTPRQLACLLATLMLMIAAGSLQARYTTIGHITGWLIVGATGVNVTTGFCIPSWI